MDAGARGFGELLVPDGFGEHGADDQVGAADPAGAEPFAVHAGDEGLDVLAAGPRPRPAAWPLRNIGDVKPAQSGGHGEFSGSQVEQAQPVPEPVLAHGALRPHHRIAALGLAAFVVPGQLVTGHDGHQLSAGERNQSRDLSAPAQDGLGNPGWPVGGDPETAKLPGGDIE